MSRSDVESKAGLQFGPEPGFKRLRLTIAYCGTPWRGWQSQEGGGGVQDEINAAIRKVQKALAGSSTYLVDWSNDWSTMLFFSEGGAGAGAGGGKVTLGASGSGTVALGWRNHQAPKPSPASRKKWVAFCMK